MPVKHSEKRPGEKLLTLYTLLMVRGERAISLTELARILVCSKQTVSRLLLQLEASDYGKLAETIKIGRAHHYRLAPLPNAELNIGIKELMQLNLCRNLLLQILPKGVSDLLGDEEGTTNYAQKSVLPSSFARLANTYHKGYIDYSAFEKQYGLLLDAIRKQKICKVTYKRSPSNPARTITFAPMRLISYRESLSFLGWEVNDVKPFERRFDNSLSLYLQRCQDVQITKHSAAHLPEPTYAQNANISPFGTMQGDSFQVCVLFQAEPASYIYDRVWSDRQSITVHDDGSLTLDFDAQSAPEIVSWVLSFGSKVKVLEPQWLKDEVKRQTTALKHMYEN